MKRKGLILLLVVSMLLLTSCTRDYYENKGDKYFAAQDYEKAETYYLKALEKEADSSIYIKLADLYGQNFQYDKERTILSQGFFDLKDSADLNVRYAQYKALMGDGESACIYLLDFLYDTYYDEEVMKEFLKIYIDYRYWDGVDYYYEEFKDKIKDIETKILAYKAVSSDSPLKEELEQELLKSKDIRAYEVLIEEFYDNREYERVEDLIVQLESMKDGLDLSKTYSKLLEMDNFNIMNKQLGHFINRDKRDMVVLYRQESSSLDIYLALIDGKSGEIVIDKKIEEFQPDFVDLDTYEVENELDRLAVTSYYGASATSGKKFSIFEFSENDFKEIEPSFESDLEIKLLEGFKIQIESKDLKTRYIVEIPKNDRLAYVEDGQFDKNGVPKENGNTRVYGDGYSLKRRGDYKDTIMVLSGFGGAHRYSADRLGFIEELYNEIDGKFKLTAFNVRDIEGMTKEIEYIEGVRVVTISETEQSEESQAEEIEITEEVLYPEYLVEDDYKLLIGDKTIFISSGIDHIINILGPGEVKLLEKVNEDYSYYEYKKEGLDIVYAEKNTPMGIEKYIQVVLVEQEGIKTIRGLEVGMDEDKIEKLYGPESLIYEDENELIYLYPDNQGIQSMDLFIIVDKNSKKVVRYHYSSNL